jgi:hypothetical protein
LFEAFFTNIKISTNRPTSTSQKIGNQPSSSGIRFLVALEVLLCAYS